MTYQWERSEKLQRQRICLWCGGEEILYGGPVGQSELHDVDARVIALFQEIKDLTDTHSSHAFNSVPAKKRRTSEMEIEILAQVVLAAFYPRPVFSEKVNYDIFWANPTT